MSIDGFGHPVFRGKYAEKYRVSTAQFRLRRRRLAPGRFERQFGTRGHDRRCGGVHARDDCFDRRNADDSFQDRAVGGGRNERWEGPHPVLGTTLVVTIGIDPHTDKSRGHGAEFGPGKNLFSQSTAMGAPRCFKQNQQRFAFAAGPLGGGWKVVDEDLRFDVRYRRSESGGARGRRRARGIATRNRGEQQANENEATECHDLD